MQKNGTGLVRGLSLFGAFAVVVGTMIGTGVFLKARVMTCNVGTPGMVIAVWVAAGVLSLAGTLTYAELAAMFPEAGGEYVFIREAYGPRWSFVYGWTQFVVVYTASAAAKGVGFALFLNDLTGGWLTGTYFTVNVLGHAIEFGKLQIVALSIVTIVTLINCLAVSVSSKIATVLTALKMLLLLGIGLGAFFLSNGSWSHFSMSGVAGTCEGVSATARGGMFGFGAAMLGALWAYDGWSNLTVVGGEVDNPHRNLPLALIGGMAVVSLLYVMVNVAYFYVLTPLEVASVSKSFSVAGAVAQKLMGAFALTAIAAGLLTSTLGSLYSGILTGARIPYAMAKDRIFFSALAKVSKRTHVPVPALAVQGAWVCVLALSGSFDALTDYAMFGAWIFYGLATASVFIFRKRRPDALRPYRTWGYPAIPIVFIIVTVFILLNTIWTMPFQSVIGIALVLVGFPLYSFWGRKAGSPA